MKYKTNELKYPINQKLHFSNKSLRKVKYYNPHCSCKHAETEPIHDLPNLYVD